MSYIDTRKRMMKTNLTMLYNDATYLTTIIPDLLESVDKIKTEKDGLEYDAKLDALLTPLDYIKVR